MKRTLFWIYIFALICITLLFFRGSPFATIEMNPIASYRRALNAPPHLARIEIAGIILNIAMFIPMGFLVPLNWPKLSHWRWLLPLAVIPTVLIETAQLITGRGVFAFEDIIHNAFGAVLGFLAYKIVKRFV